MHRENQSRNTPNKYIKYEEATKILSLRELQVIKLISEGLTNNEIAVELRISPHTVKTHRKNISKKLELRGQNKLLLWILEESK